MHMKVVVTFSLNFKPPPLTFEPSPYALEPRLSSTFELFMDDISNFNRTRWVQLTDYLALLEESL